jgi:hypothetical protein
MIELTTGIAFLVSSIYGGTTQNTSIANSVSTASSTQSHIEQSTSEARFINSKAVEAYVKDKYSDEPILVDIARCESTYRQFDQTGNILRGKVNQGDVGVMQINEKYHADDATKLGINIYTVEGNVAFGRYLYNKYGSQPWSSSSPCWGNENQLAMK